jgi:hypothetical protein
MSLKSVFKNVSNYVGYCGDMLSVVPSPEVKEQLKEKGWKFEPSEDSKHLIDSCALPYAYAGFIPMETVKTKDGVDVYREGSADLIAQYQADKKAAAKMKYGL